MGDVAAQAIHGIAKHYTWGDREFIPRLLGVEPDGEPWAELWLGTHPSGPSTFDDGTPLADVTGELGYLLKVLSASEPLSLQAHPTTEQAREGFERGVFDDAQAKPELLVALTEFEAFCGIRPAAATVELLHEIGASDLARMVDADGPGAVLRGLYCGAIDVAATIAACAESDRPEAAWVRRLDRTYPRDPSVAVTLLLNHVVLQPGEALRMTAGNLHAYLNGSGLELMQASDNVVRGGLTAKEVDIDLLLDVVDPAPLVEPVLKGADGRYPLAEAGVALVRLDPGERHQARGHELAVSLDGTTLYLAPGTSLDVHDTTFIVTTL